MMLTYETRQFLKPDWGKFSKADFKKAFELLNKEEKRILAWDRTYRKLHGKSKMTHTAKNLLLEIDEIRDELSEVFNSKF